MFVNSQHLKVNRQDFHRLARGEKTEVRILKGGDLKPGQEYPRPICVESEDTVGNPLRILMVCEAVWDERVLAISPESVSNEGFSSVDEFKRYWMLRTGKRLRPLTWVRARRLRRWEPIEDSDFFGAQLLHELYGEAFDAAAIGASA